MITLSSRHERIVTIGEATVLPGRDRTAQTESTWCQLIHSNRNNTPQALDTLAGPELCDKNPRPDSLTPFQRDIRSEKLEVLRRLSCCSNCPNAASASCER